MKIPLILKGFLKSLKYINQSLIPTYFARESEVQIETVLGSYYYLLLGSI